MKFAGFSRMWEAAAKNQTPTSARASARMRSIIERTPFERCGVRWASRPSSAKSARASWSRMYLRLAVVIDGECDGDQPTHQMRVAVAAEVQHLAARRIGRRFALDPHLADAAAHLVGLVVRALVERLEGAAKLQDVAVAIFPIFEEGEIIANLGESGQGEASWGSSGQRRLIRFTAARWLVAHTRRLAFARTGTARMGGKLPVRCPRWRSGTGRSILRRFGRERTSGFRQSKCPSGNPLLHNVVAALDLGASFNFVSSPLLRYAQ